MSAIITSLEKKRLIWRAGLASLPAGETIRTGYVEMDNAFAGGWPKTGVIGIQSVSGIGELRLVLPGLIQQRRYSERLLVFISPPWLVNAEMLFEQGFDLSKVVVLKPNDINAALWCAEQCLKSGCCAAVLLWIEQLQMHQVKRLGMAAEHGNALNFIFSSQCIFQGMALSLSLTLEADEQGIQVKVNKRKGGWPIARFPVDMRFHWPKLTHQNKPENLFQFPQRQVR